MSCFKSSTSRSRNPAPVVSHSRTTMQVHTLEHYWIIENFSKCHQRESNYLDSGPFFEDPKYKFFMRLYPIGDTDDKDTRKHISMYLNFRSADPKVEAATVGCKFAILNRLGLKSYGIGEFTFLSLSLSWNYIIDNCCFVQNSSTKLRMAVAGGGANF